MEGFAIFSPLRSNNGLLITEVSVLLLLSPPKMKLEKVNFKSNEAQRAS